MSWLKISFAVKKDQLDIVSEQLEQAGAQAVTIEDAGDHPLFDLLDGEQPVWDSSLITGLFNAEQGLDAVLAELANSFTPRTLPDYQVETLADQDWERSWMDRFQPMQYGSKLWICPTWCEPPDPDATNIMLDPGLAFGSGSHETTRLCMQWLSGQELEGKSVIDYGCGSGILAITALKMGAAHALGVDIDPQALQASRQNAQLNLVSDSLQLELPENVPEQSEADIIFANILAGTLIELKSQLLGFRKPQGVLILSGVLQSQKALIIKEFEAGNIVQVVSEGDWLMMSVIAQQ
jgi:ribosomal protein L11 methyltransferase